MNANSAEIAFEAGGKVDVPTSITRQVSCRYDITSEKGSFSDVMSPSSFSVPIHRRHGDVIFRSSGVCGAEPQLHH